MSKKILLVEDQEIQRATLRSILAIEPGWSVVEAADGERALDLLCTGLRPQLCLVDLHMPHVDGMEFLRRVRRDPDLRALTVVVTSSTRDRTTILELAKLGIAGYILKPFDAEKTLGLLRPLLATQPDPDGGPLVLRDLLTKSALIIDDDPVARAALAALVKMEPHWSAAEAADGRAALDLLKLGQRPDLLFLDLRMPEIDGLALLTELRATPGMESLRVAITSGERDLEKIRTLAKLHIDAYLLKPLDAAKVRAALRAVG